MFFFQINKYKSSNDNQFEVIGIILCGSLHQVMACTKKKIQQVTSKSSKDQPKISKIQQFIWKFLGKLYKLFVLQHTSLSKQSYNSYCLENKSKFSSIYVNL